MTHRPHTLVTLLLAIGVITVISVISVIPRDAQRDALSTEAASQARSTLSLLFGKGLEIPLPYGSMRAMKDALQPDH
jgi:hypothetical protein